MKNNKISLSSREVVTRDLPLEQSVTVIKQEKETLFHNKIRRCRITDFRHDRHLFNNVNGFTLIELLVVVLIIGILAAVALPQYQKAVWKSRNTQLKTVATALNQAEQNYYLANGSFTRHFEELSIDLPLKNTAGASCGMAGESDSGRKGSNFEIQLYSSTAPIFVWYTSGPYKCAGFAYDNDGKMWCIEREGSVHFSGTAGSFCTKLEKATLSNETTELYDSANTRFYKLP